MTTVNANPVLVTGTTATVADIETAIKRFESLLNDIEVELEIRKPIEPEKTAVSQHIRRAPSLRRRFE